MRFWRLVFRSLGRWAGVAGASGNRLEGSVDHNTCLRSGKYANSVDNAAQDVYTVHLI